MGTYYDLYFLRNVSFNNYEYAEIARRVLEHYKDNALLSFVSIEKNSTRYSWYTSGESHHREKSVGVKVDNITTDIVLPEISEEFSELSIQLKNIYGASFNFSVHIVPSENQIRFVFLGGLLEAEPIFGDDKQLLSTFFRVVEDACKIIRPTHIYFDANADLKSLLKCGVPNEVKVRYRPTKQTVDYTKEITAIVEKYKPK